MRKSLQMLHFLELGISPQPLVHLAHEIMGWDMQAVRTGDARDDAQVKQIKTTGSATSSKFPPIRQYTPDISISIWKSYKYLQLTYNMQVLNLFNVEFLMVYHHFPD